jgi:hypothetical protein
VLLCQKHVVQIRAAAEHWDGSGAMVFTGVAGVYKASKGPCTEDDELHGPGTDERIDRLLNAENAALEVGCNVVRLVGLYHRTRGAHTFFLRQGNVARNGANVVNLIHYEDAACLCRAVRLLCCSAPVFRRLQQSRSVLDSMPKCARLPA